MPSLRRSSVPARAYRPAVEALEDRLLPFHCLLSFTAATFSVNEGAGTATIGVSRLRENHPAISVQVGVQSGGTATSGSDYNFTGTTLHWADGEEDTQFFKIPIVNDKLAEKNETIKLFLFNPIGTGPTAFTKDDGTSSIKTATLTIIDNDTKPKLPTLSINDVKLAEGDSGTKTFTFTVTLSAKSKSTVTVLYATANNTAKSAGHDYVAITTHKLTFKPGVTKQTIKVKVNGDTVVEKNETFFVILSKATNATLKDAKGQGTIVNDD